MNARLAARLTGWKVDIKSDTEFATEEAEAAFAGDGEEDSEFTGRCAAVLSTGKRCPNAALPGSRYCGVPAHQELAHKEAEVPATEAPAAETPLATQEEVAEAEPVARIDEEQLEAEAAAAPVERVDQAPEQPETQVEEPAAVEAPAAEAATAEEDEPAA
jgi:transcription termination/antitermination protein NusA